MAFQYQDQSSARKITVTFNQNDRITAEQTNDTNNVTNLRLPQTKIKALMKASEREGIPTPPETVFMMTKAAELFIESLSRKCYRQVQKSKKRKVILRTDFDEAVENSKEPMIFLEDNIVDMPLRKIVTSVGDLCQEEEEEQEEAGQTSAKRVKA